MLSAEHVWSFAAKQCSSFSNRFEKTSFAPPRCGQAHEPADTNTLQRVKCALRSGCDVFSPADCDHSRQAVWRHLMSLGLFSRMLPLCFTVKLLNFSVDYYTSPDIISSGGRRGCLRTAPLRLLCFCIEYSERYQRLYLSDTQN